MTYIETKVDPRGENEIGTNTNDGVDFLYSARVKIKVVFCAR